MTPWCAKRSRRLAAAWLALATAHDGKVGSSGNGRHRGVAGLLRTAKSYNETASVFVPELDLERTHNDDDAPSIATDGQLARGRDFALRANGCAANRCVAA